MISTDLLKHAPEFLRRLRDKKYEVSPAGIHFPAAGVVASGVYTTDINGKDVREDHNLIPDEGLIYLLTAGVANAPRYSAWFLSLYSANYTPLANLTSANYPATANEITSATEGYSNTTRRPWTQGAVGATASIDNLAAKATFDIVTSSSLIITGMGLHSESAKGATTGKLISAAKLANARTAYNGDAFNVAYRVQLVASA